MVLLMVGTRDFSCLQNF